MIYPLAVILTVAFLNTVTSEIQWKEVGTNVVMSQAASAIPHSFERTAVQFKTDKVVIKTEELELTFFSGEKRDSKLGGISVRFNTDQTLTYKIADCQTAYNKFPENMPTEVEKLWSIIVTTGAQPSFKVQVNGVEVINLLLTDDTCTMESWRDSWTGEITHLGFNSWASMFAGYHLDSCYGGHYLDAESDCQECPVDQWSTDAGDTACTPCPAGTHVGAGLGLAESDCTEGEGDSTNANGDETEHGNNHNYSQAVAHKLSALFVVLLFALNI